MLTARERYVIEMAPTAWDDGGIPVEPGDSPWEAANWMQKLLFIAAVPLRRELFQDWFEVVVRYGRTGGEEAFYIYDPTASKIEFPMRPTRDGELFVFVNDAVIGLPLLYDRLYRNNHGSAKIFVTLKKKTERQSERRIATRRNASLCSAYRSSCLALSFLVVALRRLTEKTAGAFQRPTRHCSQNVLPRE